MSLQFPNETATLAVSAVLAMLGKKNRLVHTCCWHSGGDDNLSKHPGTSWEAQKSADYPFGYCIYKNPHFALKNATYLLGICTKTPKNLKVGFMSGALRTLIARFTQVRICQNPKILKLSLCLAVVFKTFVPQIVLWSISIAITKSFNVPNHFRFKYLLRLGAKLRSLRIEISVLLFY